MDTKNWWESKTVWSGVITIGAIAAGYFGLDIGNTDKEALIDGLTTIVATVGALLAIVFRIKATKTVK